MNQKFEILSEIIKNRRAIFPTKYKPGKISAEILEAILENARWAPTHKKTEPWRFVLIESEGLKQLSDFLSQHYQSKTTEETFDPVKFQKAGEKPLQSAAVIAICIQRSPESLIPEWEETAAVACAVQNMWLSCTALGIGSYWSSPDAIYHMKNFLHLNENEYCLGLFFMGWSDYDAPATERKSLDLIVKKLPD